MPGVFFRHAFSLKHVAKVTLTVGTHNFHSFHSKRNVGVTGDRAGYLVIKGRPAAAAVKLVTGVVQRRVAASADEMSLCFEVVILPRKSPFCTFLGNDVLLFGREGVPVLSVVSHVFILH